VLAPEGGPETPPQRMKPEEFDEVVDFCDLVFAGNGNGKVPYLPALASQ
jgi:hypothetical protein